VAMDGSLRAVAELQQMSRVNQPPRFDTFPYSSDHPFVDLRRMLAYRLIHAAEFSPQPIPKTSISSLFGPLLKTPTQGRGFRG